MADHAAKARALLRTERTNVADAAVAQAHATLYLAEQTRIQNVLLYNSVTLQVDLGNLSEFEQNEIKRLLGG